MTDRLILSDGPGWHRPLPESVGPPSGRWMGTTAQHLAHWAIFLSVAAESDASSAEDIAALLEKALEASPLNPSARLAMAQLEARRGGKAGSIRSLGQCRDAVSLAWSARMLLEAGKADSALYLYNRAITLAAAGAGTRAGTPRFNDDPAVRRYLLPREKEVRDIAIELATREGWNFAKWSPALPPDPIVWLAVARVLRERGRKEADTLIDRILTEPSQPTPLDAENPCVLAARAEAFALRSRWKDAEREYLQAIERIDDDTIRRSWWFNLADVAFRLSDEGERQMALRAATAVARTDDITRRATEIQRVSSVRPPLRLGGAKAN
jgi:tetratricopeptide (TPR) repeat protein